MFSFVNNSCYLRIADLEKQLAEREQETKDLEVKLFESSMGRSKGPSFDDEPLPTQKTNRALFNEDAVLSTPSCPPMATPSRGEDTSRKAIADRYKGSSIAFDYAPSPPDLRKRADSFKTPQIQRRATMPVFAQQDEDTGDTKRLEEVIKQRENDLSTLRLELASAQSEVEQLRKGDTGSSARQGGEHAKLVVELEKEKVKVSELESRLVKVQQEAECKLHNSEAAKTSLEVKIKTQEKELRAEVGEATSEAARLGKQLEEVGDKKQEELECNLFANFRWRRGWSRKERQLDKRQIASPLRWRRQKQVEGKLLQDGSNLPSALPFGSGPSKLATT